MREGISLLTIRKPRFFDSSGSFKDVKDKRFCEQVIMGFFSHLFLFSSPFLICPAPPQFIYLLSIFSFQCFFLTFVSSLLFFSFIISGICAPC
ncbi:hypothetical protein MSSAC_2878 [Methanosarcina siciliae C2J]|uniref:Transmembrane protein n=1 Tax=Methanosarcina siciliae C2J TaxID=1434118 RepID=A0A0E3PQA5_9EURY|nr:hypothetical protein MSSAC_2878 [Methanosarcina siciliae C2J]